jgi:hypothetical protein
MSLHELTTEQRNKALSLAKHFEPCTVTSERVAHLSGLKRLTTVKDYILQSDACAYQIDELGREPYLLLPDELNFGVVPCAIYDGSGEPDDETGKYILDLHRGLVLLDGDVAVYWK